MPEVVGDLRYGVWRVEDYVIEPPRSKRRPESRAPQFKTTETHAQTTDFRSGARRS